MARQSPADKLVRLERAIRAWEARRPHAAYHGFTLSKFKAAVQPSLDTRKEISELQARLQAAVAQRNQADAKSMRHLRHVVNGVKGDPDEGDDGRLYEEMGYVPKQKQRRRKPRRPERGAALSARPRSKTRRKADA